MKVIIAGSRSIDDYAVICEAIKNSGFEITSVVSGGAVGVDSLGEVYATNNGLPLFQFFPNWSKWGRGAGFVRNKQMARFADALIAIWDGESRGTKHMIDIATEKGLKVFVWKIHQNITTIS